MSKVPYSKPALNYAEQLQQLKERGLFIDNEAKALHILEHVSYYRLSAYWYPMLETPKSDHRFKPGSSFENAFKLYCFDRELRNLIWRELEKIEVAIRSRLIYELSHLHGPFWYTNPTLFKSQVHHESIIKKTRLEYERSDERFIMDFHRKYKDPLPPSWMMLELTSFGGLSLLYKNLNDTHARRSIAHFFGLDDASFQSWLHSIVYVRNVCAHHSRLWSRTMRISPSIPEKPRNTFLNASTGYNGIDGVKIENNRVFYLLSMIIYWLDIINPHSAFKNRFMSLLINYPMVDVKAMGFPSEWVSEPLWL